MAAKTCPKCELVHPASAVRCECGYDFETGVTKAKRKAEPTHWADEPAVAIAAVFFCSLLGLFLVWRNKEMSYGTKVVVTFAGFAVWAAMIFFRLSQEASR